MIRKIFLIAALSFLGIGAFAGYAYSEAETHDFPALRGTAMKRLMVMQQDTATVVSNPAFAFFTSDTITVPATGQYRAVVRFSGESQCDAASWCSARVLVDGIEANPKSGTDFAFDSPGGPTFISPSIDRTSDIISGTGAARNVTVDLQVAVVGGGTWRIDDWSVVAELVAGAT